MFKKFWRISVNRISKVRQTTCNWIKKMLDEITRVVNVLLISWFFYLFLFCSISLLVQYDFTFRYEAWVNAITTSSCIENFPQISVKLIAFQRNLLRKLSRNRLFFTNCFSAKLASKIPTKFPQNRPFFPRICPWKSREILLFFTRPTRSPAESCFHSLNGQITSLALKMERENIKRCFGGLWMEDQHEQSPQTFLVNNFSFLQPWWKQNDWYFFKWVLNTDCVFKVSAWTLENRNGNVQY